MKELKFPMEEACWSKLHFNLKDNLALSLNEKFMILLSWYNTFPAEASRIREQIGIDLRKLYD